MSSLFIIVIAIFYTSTAANEMLMKMNNQKLLMKSYPGDPGFRSDLYEVYMEPRQFPTVLTALAEMKALGRDGNPIPGVRGLLTFTQNSKGLRINGTISGLRSAGKHGFHVHQSGDLRRGCDSAGPHFNPYQEDHGGLEDPLRHVGDLGNVNANAAGVARIEISDRYLTLTGVRGAIGRAIIVHDLEDDLGRGGTEISRETGTSGDRLACGIIGFL